MDNEDNDFISAFEELTLPRAEWNHQAHLRMAYLYAQRQRDFTVLLSDVRTRIQAFNRAQGNPAGYHETITAAFLHLVLARLKESLPPTFAAFEEANPDLFAPGGTVLHRYYKRETLYSSEARTRFVEPDQEPLPEISSFTSASEKRLPPPSTVQ